MGSKQITKVAFITGASSGIGAGVARELATHGYNLVLFARRKERLEALATELGQKVQVEVAEGNVRSDDDLNRAVGVALQKFGRIDLVLANAGFGVVGNFESLSYEDYQRQFETNVYGVLRTAWATQQALKASRGVMGILGSLNGIVSLPGSSAYGMSKHAIRSFAASLHLEWAPYGVSVTHLAPGFVQSEIFQIDNQGQWHDNVKDQVPGWIRVPTPRASKEIVRALLKRKREVVITGHAKIVAALNQVFPWLIPLTIKTLKWNARKEPGTAQALEGKS